MLMDRQSYNRFVAAILVVCTISLLESSDQKIAAAGVLSFFATCYAIYVGVCDERD